MISQVHFAKLLELLFLAEATFVFWVNWICAIIICMFLKDTITIQVTALVPLEFSTCLKYAIMYA
jgi:hypothetical protein